MSRHTPGPWELHGFCENGTFPGIVHERHDKDGKRVHAEQVLPFYDCDPQGKTYARHMADKRLIESAPDMYRALNQFIDEFERGREWISYDTLDMAVRVIKKVNGE